VERLCTDTLADNIRTQCCMFGGNCQIGSWLPNITGWRKLGR
jgi:hypothetical protein